MQLNHSCKRIFHIPHFKKIPICVYALAFLVLSQKSESSTVKSTKVTFKSRVKSPKLFVKIQIYAPTLPLPFFLCSRFFTTHFTLPIFTLPLLLRFIMSYASMLLCPGSFPFSFLFQSRFSVPHRLYPDLFDVPLPCTFFCAAKF